MGDRAVLLESSDIGAVAAIAQAVQRALARGDLGGIAEVVPAARTVLLCCDDWKSVQSVLAWAREREVDTGDSSSLSEPRAVAELSDHVFGQHRTVTIDVVYNGDDLTRVANLLDMSRESLIAVHTAAAWRAAFGGFAPGFMYLSAEDWPHRLPRLDTPRERVAAGSVALAGEFSAVYPAPSPGGWQLIGHTDAELWNLDRLEPALVRPGDTVQFRASREALRVSGATGSPRGDGKPTAQTPEITSATAPASDTLASPSITPVPTPAFTVVRPGVQALIQDAGRPGYRAVGVTESGAMDRAALACANAAVGNPVGAAAIEVVAGGLELQVERSVTVAIAGSAVNLEIHGAGERRTIRSAEPISVQPGQRLTLTYSGPGMRDYLAVRGGLLGITTPRDGAEPRSWLGSRSTDTLSGIGPRRLAAGDAVHIGEVPAAVATSETGLLDGPQARQGQPSHQPPQAPDSPPTVLRVLAGPRADWFTPDALRALGQATWTVSAQADRVGARLTGPPLERSPAAAQAELPSEGMVRGALQVPPGGAPVLFLADHPVTGGYPVIGVVIDADLDRAGQLAPGDPVQFELVDEQAGGGDGVWPSPLPATSEASEVSNRPAWVNCTLEIDGRRHAIRIPGALAAALDWAWGTEPSTAPQAEPRTVHEHALADAADELIEGIVRAIRSSVSDQAPPGPPQPTARPSRTD